MKKILVLLLIIFLAGCMRVRTYTVEKPRKDTDIEGNQGYLVGEAGEAKKESQLGTTRKVSVLEFEFGPKSKETVTDTKRTKESFQQEVYQEETYQEEEIMAPQIKTKEYDMASSEYDYQDYTIKENDTLQKISRKFYGTTKKWELIYQENKDTLKSPDKIYPGTTIKVPILK
ncbi:MAG: LysM peptidoglycan-binding domain-containing protein [Candidatus Omnitrophica bacterium]|nr:LysM peptidoglycan-binding domain-containing protein [Candidatus Omnitrophota bacterium]MCF7894162.1 LysM peptidoglycan-binding domain-containing protein [Candidatus Omnitrophota bacterium]